MRIIFALAIGTSLASCGEPAQEPEEPGYGLAANAPAFPPAESLSEPEFVAQPSPTPSSPPHNYDARNGLFYSYVAAISEDDRKAGKAAGDVVTYAYLGMRGSNHVLARVRPNGSVLGEVYCGEPCKVVTYPDGTQFAYTESSIIGSAFADAIGGQLEVASYDSPQKPSAYQATPLPAATATSNANAGPKWTEQEAIVISKWVAADQSCRFGTSVTEQDDGCANRDGIYSASLSQSGICTSRKTQFGTEQAMHRCDESSVVN